MLKVISRTLWIFGTLTHLQSLSFATELLKKHSSRPLQAESSMEALKPWETPVSGFFIRSHQGVPVVPPTVASDQWVLTIDGLVDKPVTLKLADLKKMQQKSLHAVLECSGNGRAYQKPGVPGVQWQRGAVGNAEWSGVKLSDLLAQAGVKKNAHFVRLEGGDQTPFATVPKFIRSVPLEKMLHEDTLVAWDMNREPMPSLHGGPLRLVLSGWYGENWVKWLTHITLTETEDSGFFMKKGYRMPIKPVKPGEVWDSSTGGPIEEILVQSIIVHPSEGQSLPQGNVQVDGKAFSGAGTISKVELSVDQGKTWQAADVTPAHKDGGWQEFHKSLPVITAGPLVLLSRATDSRGNQQPLEHNWNPGGYLRNAVDSVKVEVSAPGSSKAAASKFVTTPVPSRTPVVTDDSLVSSRCLTCHTRELIESQRLTPKQWEGVLKKMEGFGVTLDAEDKKSLLLSLQKFSPEMKESVPQLTHYQSEIDLMSKAKGNLPKGVAKRGALLFTQYCVACHGAEGEGKLGPRLRGRIIPVREFWSTVQSGKGVMPPFASILKKQDIADIHKFIQDFQ